MSNPFNRPHPMPHARPRPTDPDELWAGLLEGDRMALSRAITLAESRHPDHQAIAGELLGRCSGLRRDTLRIGVTGLPGSGKSTFIEAIGQRMLHERGPLAVLAIDPSSPIHQGSILGDRTRMPILSSHPDVFIRPSPSSGLLGGVASATQDAITLCEAAGFGTVLIETVGVGQSEASIRHLSDLVILLLIAGAGDELQGMKGGVLELADIVAVNKAEGDRREAAERTLEDYRQAFGLRSGAEETPRLSILCSALTGEGIDTIWDWCRSANDQMRRDGRFDHRRGAQASEWLLAAVRKRLELEFLNHPASQQAMERALTEVRDGNRDIHGLAEVIIRRFRAG